VTSVANILLDAFFLVAGKIGLSGFGPLEIRALDLLLSFVIHCNIDVFIVYSGVPSWARRMSTPEDSAD
jgi:hypothetical protein